MNLVNAWADLFLSSSAMKLYSKHVNPETLSVNTTAIAGARASEDELVRNEQGVTSSVHREGFLSFDDVRVVPGRVYG